MHEEKKKNPHAVELGRLGGKSKSRKKLDALKLTSKKPRPGARKRKDDEKV